MEKKSDKKEEEKPKNSKEIKKSELENEAEKIEGKEIRKIEEINEEEFEDFLEDVEFRGGSPSLRKINSSQDTAVNLEKGLADVSPSANANEKKSEEKKPFNYLAKGGNPNEPKYQQYEANDFSEITHVEIESLGRANMFERQDTRNIGFAQSSEAKAFETTNIEKYEPVKRVDVEKLGRGDFNRDERREIKYKPLR